MTTDPVRQLAAERPTMFDHRFAGMKPSFQVAEGIHGVESISNVYLINTSDGDIQINAGMGFEALAGEIHKPAKSLHRMLSQSGNPTMSNISAVFAAIKRALKVEVRTQIVMA